MSMQDVLEQIRSLLKKKRGRISAISREIPQELLKKQSFKPRSVEQALENQSLSRHKVDGQQSTEMVRESAIAGGELEVEEKAAGAKAEEKTAGAVEEQGIDSKTEYIGGNVMRVIPVYNMMVLPHSYIYFQVQSFRNIAGQEIKQDDHVLLAVLKEDSFNTKDLRKEEFHSVAVEGSVTEISGDGYVVVRTGQRVRILELAQKEGEPLLLETAPLRDIEDLDHEDSERKLKEIKAELKTLVDRFRAGSIMQTMIDQYGSIQEVACILSPWLSLKNEERYRVLKEDRLSVRIKMLEQILYEYVEVTKVTSDARNQQQEDYQKLYKEQALQKQIA